MLAFEITCFMLGTICLLVSVRPKTDFHLMINQLHGYLALYGAVSIIIRLVELNYG